MLIEVKGSYYESLVGEILHENGIEFEEVDPYIAVCEDIMQSVSENAKPEGVSDEEFKSACEIVLDLIIRKYDFQDLVNAAQDYLDYELEELINKEDEEEVIENTSFEVLNYVDDEGNIVSFKTGEIVGHIDNEKEEN